MKRAWEASGHRVQTIDLPGRLVVVHDQLHSWDWTILKAPQRKLESVRRELAEVTRKYLSPEMIAMEKELAIEVEKLLE